MGLHRARVTPATSCIPSPDSCSTAPAVISFVQIWNAFREMLLWMNGWFDGCMRVWSVKWMVSWMADVQNEMRHIWEFYITISSQNVPKMKDHLKTSMLLQTYMNFFLLLIKNVHYWGIFWPVITTDAFIYLFIINTIISTSTVMYTLLLLMSIKSIIY